MEGKPLAQVEQFWVNGEIEGHAAAQWQLRDEAQGRYAGFPGEIRRYSQPGEERR